MVLREVNDDGHEDWEGLVLVGLENIEEVVILEETHGSVSHLQMITTNTLDNTLEEPLNQWFDVLDFADLNNLLKLGEEKRLLDTVSKGPKLEKTLEERNSQGAVLREEEHGAPEELLVELAACLHLVERYDHIVEELNVLLPQGHSEPGDDARQDVEELGRAIELVRLVYQSVEALVHRLPDHFPSGNQLCIKLVQNVLEVVAFHRFFSVQQVEELLHELGRDVDLQLTDLNRLIDHKLEEEFVNALKVGPSGVHFFLLLHTCLRKVQIALLDIGKRSENILFNHLHDQV